MQAAPPLQFSAGGLDQIYPSSNRSLAIQIIQPKRGALVSEYPAGTTTFRTNFAVRNRIITGLSLALIVVEAEAKSGTENAVKFALAQGREIMAVPGNITSPYSAGPNKHIRDGATIITGSADVLAGLNLDNIAQQPVRAASPEEQAILELIKQGTSQTQQLIEQSKLTASQFANLISLMEIAGRVKNLGSGTWVSTR